MAKLGFLAKLGSSLGKGAAGTARAAAAAGVGATAALGSAIGKAVKAEQAAQAAVQTEQKPAQAAAPAAAASTSTSTGNAPSAITLQDIIQNIDIPTKEFEPNFDKRIRSSGKYDAQLNEIIVQTTQINSRLAQQESWLASVAASVNNYNELLNKQFETNRQQNERAQQQRQEDNGERRSLLKSAIGALGLIGGAGLAGRLLGLAVPAGLLALSGALQAYESQIGPGEEGESMTVGEVIETADTAMSKGAAASLATRTAGGQQVVQNAKGVITGVAGKIAGNPTIVKMMEMARSFRAFLANLNGKMTEVFQKAGEFVAKFGVLMGSAGNRMLGVLKKSISVKVVLLFDLFDWMSSTLLELMMSPEPDMDKFHKESKQKINDVLKVLGTPWVLAIIGGVIGTAIPIPFIGNAAGAFAGTLVGLIWGEDIYEAFALDQVIDAMYDAAVTGSFDPFKALWNKLTAWSKGKIDQLIDAMTPEITLGGQPAGEAIGMTVDELGAQTTQTASNIKESVVSFVTGNRKQYGAYTADNIARFIEDEFDINDDGQSSVIASDILYRINKKKIKPTDPTDSETWVDLAGTAYNERAQVYRELNKSKGDILELSDKMVKLNLDFNQKLKEDSEYTSDLPSVPGGSAPIPAGSIQPAPKAQVVVVPMQAPAVVLNTTQPPAPKPTSQLLQVESASSGRDSKDRFAHDSLALR